MKSCLDCKGRKIGCHGTCEKYIEEAKRYADDKEKFKNSSAYNFITRSQYMNAIYRFYRNNKKAHAYSE